MPESAMGELRHCNTIEKNWGNVRVVYSIVQYRVLWDIRSNKKKRQKT